MEKKYIVRKIDPSTPRRIPQPRNRRPQRRRWGRGGLPLGFILLAAAVVVIVIIVLVVVLGGKGKEQDRKDTSSVVSQVSAVGDGMSSLPVFSDVSSVVSEPEPVMPEPDAPDSEPEDYGWMAIAGDTGYEYYNFSEEDTIDYIKLVCESESYLPEGVTLYEMLVPTSLDIMLPEDYINEYNINSSDQRKAIEEYIYPSMHNLNERVKTVSLFDPLRMHCNEYIYLRSDSCWTQLGAYYAYVEFCKSAELTPVELDEFDRSSYDGFLGDFYRSSQDSGLEGNPDTMEAYFFSADASLAYTSASGESVSNWPVIQNGENYNSELLNLIFKAGDQPYSEIENHDLDDGSACIVVAESFGNTFVPFLVNHYQYIYVIDYRTWSGSIPDLAEETGAQDVILLNSIVMTSDEDSISDLSSVF